MDDWDPNTFEDGPGNTSTTAQSVGMAISFMACCAVVLAFTLAAVREVRPRRTVAPPASSWQLASSAWLVEHPAALAPR